MKTRKLQSLLASMPGGTRPSPMHMKLMKFMAEMPEKMKKEIARNGVSPDSMHNVLMQLDLYRDTFKVWPAGTPFPGNQPGPK